MPLYEYYCDDCQIHFTLLQPTSVNKEETLCDQCGGGNVRYEMSTFASKVIGSPGKTSTPVTEADYPNKNVFNLPIPKLRSEL